MGRPLHGATDELDMIAVQHPTPELPFFPSTTRRTMAATVEPNWKLTLIAFWTAPIHRVMGGS
jgi:hypothetical protein